MKYSILVFTLYSLTIQACTGQDIPLNYLRFAHEGNVAYGLLKGETIYELEGDLFDEPKETGKRIALHEVDILIPCTPSKVLAVGLNYKSHIGDRPIPEYPGLFAKFPTSLAAHGDEIQMPHDATNLHYEGELVIVIGKKAKQVSQEEAMAYVFGVTAGNDLSERNWQRQDLQWLRAKASDGFAPVGPVITSGINYKDLLVQTRVNGEVVQSERSGDLIYNVDEIVSYISQYVTLLPGDLIFTGTPQTTKALKPGDVVEIEIEGVGILKNKIID